MPDRETIAQGADMTGQRSEVARVSGPVTGGKGWPFGSPLNVAKYGCVLEEFLIEGVAQSYEPAPGGAIGLDGKWTVQPADTAGQSGAAAPQHPDGDDHGEGDARGISVDAPG